MILWKKTTSAILEEVGFLIEPIEEQLKKVDPKQRIHIVMIIEDFLVDFVKNNTDEEITLQVEKKMGEYQIKIFQKGTAFNPLLALAEDYGNLTLEEEGPLEQIRRVLYQSYGDGIRYFRKGNRNCICLKIVVAGTKTLFMNLSALVIAFVIGAFLPEMLPEVGLNFLSAYFLDPVITVFTNLLSFVMVPIVFFSVATCVGGFSDLSELGRIGGKAMGFYIATGIIASIIAISIFYVLPSSAASIQVEQSAELEMNAMEVSLIDTIVEVFPANIVEPFFIEDTLQLICIGLLICISLSMIGAAAQPVLNLLELGNQIFVNIMGMVMKFMPLVILCTVTSSMLEYGVGVLISLLGLLGSLLLGFAILYLFYGFMFFLFSGKSPVSLYRKTIPVLVTAFSTCNSSASIPSALEICKEKLGIPSKICSFTIPLGAAINMDGGCMFNILVVLFLTEVYGIAVTIPMLLSLVGIVMSISIGLPGMPGVMIIGLSMCVAQLGLPVKSVGIVMGICNFIDMPWTASDVMGDLSITSSITASEKQLNTQMYEAK